MVASEGGTVATAEPVSVATSDKLRPSWRDHLKIHPAAELFPLMSEPELRELGEDIKTNGLLSPIAIYDGALVDGRNRLDAIELVGLKFEFIRHRGYPDGRSIIVGISSVDFDAPLHPVQQLSASPGSYGDVYDPYDFVISATRRRFHDQYMKLYGAASV
jgi:hypothetical protein